MDDAISHAVATKKLDWVDADFLLEPGARVVVRGLIEEGQTTARNVSQVSPKERQLAVLTLVADSRRVERTELRQAVARIFGWRRNGTDIESSIEADIQAMLALGVLKTDDGTFISLPPTAVATASSIA
jgi:hypothetical protein